MTSCPFWLTRTRATCTQQVTHADIKKKVLLYFKRHFSTLATRWVWEVLQRRGAHGSLGWTARSEWFRVFLFVGPSISFYSTFFVPAWFSVASFDTSSAAVHRSRSGQRGHHKDWRGVWQRAHHPCVCYHFCSPSRNIIRCLRDHLREPMCRYMHHAYGLGEHYNSVERLKDPANADGSWETPHSRVTWDDLPLLNDNDTSQAESSCKDVRGALKSTSLPLRILGNDDFSAEFRSISNGTAHPCQRWDSCLNEPRS